MEEKVHTTPGATTKTCPLCGASAPSDQEKCLYCGKLLVNAAVVSAAVPRVPRSRDKTDAFAWLLLALPVLMAMYALLHISGLHPLHSPWRKLLILVITSFPAMAAVVVLDAEKLKRATDAAINPVQWFAKFFIGWPWLLKNYFIARREAGRKDWARRGLAAELAFAGGTFLAACIILIRQEFWSEPQPYGYKGAPSSFSPPAGTFTAGPVRLSTPPASYNEYLRQVRESSSSLPVRFSTSKPLPDGPKPRRLN